MALNAKSCHQRRAWCSFPSVKVPPRGAELSDDSPGNRPVSKQRDAEYDAFSGVDLELVAVIQAWAELSESVKAAVGGDGQGLLAVRIIAQFLGLGEVGVGFVKLL